MQKNIFVFSFMSIVFTNITHAALPMKNFAYETQIQSRSTSIVRFDSPLMGEPDSWIGNPNVKISLFDIVSGVRLVGPIAATSFYDPYSNPGIIIDDRNTPHVQIYISGRNAGTQSIKYGSNIYTVVLNNDFNGETSNKDIEIKLQDFGLQSFGSLQFTVTDPQFNLEGTFPIQGMSGFGFSNTNSIEFVSNRGPKLKLYAPQFTPIVTGP